MNLLSRLTILVCLAAMNGSMSFAQPAAPKAVDIADDADKLSEIFARAKSTYVLNPNRRFVVEGDTYFGAQLLATNELIFKPKARLIFQDGTPNTSGSFYIVANKIVVEDPNKPGIITWQRNIPAAPADRGQAPAGPGGSGEGARGGDGASGAPGATGLTGPSAPALTVFTRNAGQGGLVADFSGGEGGPGGVGQIGGNSGAGTRGSSARQSRTPGPFNTTIWLPSCESGPGQGGNGGNGGIGGPGGLGGKGGNGGNVTLVSTPERIATLFQAVRVNMGGGDGGPGGLGGGGGQGGPGGSEGQLASFCNSAGRNGVAGSSGSSGAVGGKGEQGRAGQPFVSHLSEDQFKALVGFQ